MRFLSLSIYIITYFFIKVKKWIVLLLPILFVLEATVRFERTIKILQTSVLATSLRRHIIILHILLHESENILELRPAQSTDYLGLHVQ